MSVLWIRISMDPNIFAGSITRGSGPVPNVRIRPDSDPPHFKVTEAQCNSNVFIDNDICTGRKLNVLLQYL
jgi:hypothetical protein